MDDYDHLTRNELISLVRELKETAAAGRGPLASQHAGFPVFGERQQREFDTSPWPMRIFEHGTLKYLAVNDAALRLYGYSREEFLRLTARETRHPEEHDVLLATFAEPTGYLRYGPPRRQIKKSGEVIVAEVVAQDILFDGRKARLSLTLDVTERTRVHELLRRREKEFESLAENLPDLVARYDRDRKFRYVNSAIERALGIPREKIVGRTQRELGLPGELVATYDDSLARVFDTGLAHKLEFRMALPAGERLFEAYHVPEKDTGDRVATVLCVARDITDRKRIERALLESESQYRTLVETSGDLIWSTDADGRITFINQAVRRIYGYEPGEMLGRPAREFLGEGYRRKAFGFFRRLLAEDQSAPDYECEVRRKDGERVVLASNATVLRDGQGRRSGITGISKDITDRKLAEQKRLTEVIRQRDTLVHEVHHRIKNHLQGIVGLLRNKIGDSPSTGLAIEEAITQLQSVGAVYGLESEPVEGGVPLYRVLEAICTSVESLGNGCIARRFATNATGALRLAEAEAVPVAVALNELVFNALKHGAAPGGGPPIEVELAEGKDGATIRIVNRGRLSAGFDFPRGTGTGTGLDLVRTLLAPPGSELTFNVRGDTVETCLNLRPPLVAARIREAIA